MHRRCVRESEMVCGTGSERKRVRTVHCNFLFGRDDTEPFFFILLFVALHYTIHSKHIPDSWAHTHAVWWKCIVNLLNCKLSLHRSTQRHGTLCAAPHVVCYMRQAVQVTCILSKDFAWEHRMQLWIVKRLQRISIPKRKIKMEIICNAVITASSRWLRWRTKSVCVCVAMRRCETLSPICMQRSTCRVIVVR